MNKVLYLDDIRDNNSNMKNNYMHIIQNRGSVKAEENNLKKIIKNLFFLENKSALIDMINYIYDDKLSKNTEIEYLDKEYDVNCDKKIFLHEDTFYDMRILAKDDKRMFIYEIKFKTKDNKNISIRIVKYNLSINVGSSMNMNPKSNNEIIEKSKKGLPKSYEIMINSNIKVLDKHNSKVNFKNKGLENETKLLKSWKYDFKNLYEKNMILLYPLKVFDLRYRLVVIKNEIEELPKNNIKILPQKNKLKNYIKDETYRFFNNMNIFIDKAKNQGKLCEKDISKFNLTTIELLNYLNESEDLFLDMNERILSHLKNKYIK